MFYVTSKQIKKWLNQGIRVTSCCAGRMGDILKVEDGWVYIVKDRHKGDSQRNVRGCTTFNQGDYVIPVRMSKDWINLRNYPWCEPREISEHLKTLTDGDIRLKQSLCNKEIAIAYKEENTQKLQLLRKIEEDLMQAMLLRC